MRKRQHKAQEGGEGGRAPGLTEVPEVVGAEDEGEEDRVGRPLPLDDEGADDEQGAGDVDVVDVVAGEPGRVLSGGGGGGHGDLTFLFCLPCDRAVRFGAVRGARAAVVDGAAAGGREVVVEGGCGPTK